MKKIINKTQIFIYSLCVLFILMGTTSIILHCAIFTNIAETIVNSVIITIICAVFSTIFFFVGKKMGPDRKVKGNVIEADDLILTKKEKIKKIFLSFGILVACGIGYIPLFIIGANNVKKINSENFVKTTATIEYVISEDSSNSRLVYKYFSQDGLRFFSENGASWGAASFKEGKEITIYYSKNNPEIIIVPSNTVMAFFGASFFLIMGLLVFITSLDVGLNKSGIAGSFIGLVFMGFAACFITGIKLASGLSIIELFASGAAVYAMNCFGIVGLIIFIFGLVQGIYDIKETICYKKTHKHIKDKETIKQLLAEREETLKIEKLERKKEKKKKKNIKYGFCFSTESFFLTFGGLVFLGVGLWMIIGMSLMPLFKSLKYESIEAKVIAVETYESRESDGLMATFTYEYFVDGKRYEKESSYGQSADIAPSVGDIIKIKYNPDNPTDILDAEFTNWIMFAMGIISSGAGILLLCFAFIGCRYVKKNPNENKTQKQKNEIEIGETKNKLEIDFNEVEKDNIISKKQNRKKR